MMMIKTDVSVLYKTKLCKKFMANGYCPYGMRCQFIHEMQLSKPQAPEMNVHCQTFSQPQAQVLPGAVAAATGSGGFGNRQTSQALDLPKIIYSDILVHNTHVSIQEYQKKQKMFQKRVTKRRQQELICPPEVQYMNIYKKTVSRLSCFKSVTDEFDEANKVADISELDFHGDATAYEVHLE